MQNIGFLMMWLKLQFSRIRILLLEFMLKSCTGGNIKINLIILLLTHLSLASLLWDIGKHNSPRCDAAERGVPSGAILFA